TETGPVISPWSSPSVNLVDSRNGNASTRWCCEPRREAGAMAGTSLTKAIRRRLYSFAARIAKPFSDSRRRRFLIDMLTGLVSAGHVHLTAVARGLTRGAGNIHATEK